MVAKYVILTTVLLVLPAMIPVSARADIANPDPHKVSLFSCPILQRGLYLKSECTYRLQILLNITNYPNAIPVDGIFGPGLEHSLARFQRGAGVPADGIAGPTTKNAIQTALDIILRNPAPGAIATSEITDELDKAEVCQKNRPGWKYQGGVCSPEEVGLTSPSIQQTAWACTKFVISGHSKTSGLFQARNKIGERIVSATAEKFLLYVAFGACTLLYTGHS